MRRWYVRLHALGSERSRAAHLPRLSFHAHTYLLPLPAAYGAGYSEGAGYGAAGQEAAAGGAPPAAGGGVL
jgi:hypothetical protein